MVFDFERNALPPHDYLKIAELAAIIREFRQRTGVYPVIYVNPNWFNSRLAADPHSAADRATINKCPLWTSAYKAKPNPAEVFRGWSIWQYAGDSRQSSYGDFASPFEKSKYPRGIPGVGSRLEMNIFKGDLSALQRFWQKHSIPTRF